MAFYTQNCDYYGAIRRVIVEKKEVFAEVLIYKGLNIGVTEIFKKKSIAKIHSVDVSLLGLPVIIQKRGKRLILKNDPHGVTQFLPGAHYFKGGPYPADLLQALPELNLALKNDTSNL